MGSYILHSLFVSGITVIITVIVSIPGAYLLSHLRWRGVGAFGFLLLFTQMMPGGCSDHSRVAVLQELWVGSMIFLP